MQKFGLLFLILSLFSCSDSASAQTKIDAAKTETLLKSEANIQLVDLRTPGEVAQTGVIAGAKTFNFNSQDFDQKIAQLDKNQPVLLYCAAGSRSSSAAQQLTQMGFKKVYNYTGGMNDWKAKGKPTVKAGQ